MKYGVGDKVRVNKKDGAGYYLVGNTYTVTRVCPGEFYAYSLGGRSEGFCEKELDLVKKGENVGRKTFRLLKSTPELKRGALLQEACDDGNQPYKLMGEEFMSDRTLSDHSNYFEGNPQFSRNTVEDQPAWFVEVFPVTNEYITKDELSVFKKFKTTLRQKRGK